MSDYKAAREILRQLERVNKLVAASSIESSTKRTIAQLTLAERRKLRSVGIDPSASPPPKTEWRDRITSTGSRTIIETHDARGRWSFTVSISIDGTFVIATNGGSMIVRGRGGIRALADAVAFAADWHDAR